MAFLNAEHIMTISLDRWQATWEKLGLATPGETLFETLIQRYSEPHRKYHTTRHLEECFARLSELENRAEHLGELELALWFHDAVYDVRRSDNEERSAASAGKYLRNANASAEVIHRIHSLILGTCRHEPTSDIDAAILSDVDLWILAAPPERFQEYEQQIREEYRYVPGPLFRRKRKQVLEEFMKREKIFNTELFFDRYEAQARKNLTASLLDK
jgi:predicted metal-dependent HD superfamily phosphohydrolase